MRWPFRTEDTVKGTATAMAIAIMKGTIMKGMTGTIMKGMTVTIMKGMKGTIMKGMKGMKSTIMKGMRMAVLRGCSPSSVLLGGKLELAYHALEAALLINSIQS